MSNMEIEQPQKNPEEKQVVHKYVRLGISSKTFFLNYIKIVSIQRVKHACRHDIIKFLIIIFKTMAAVDKNQLRLVTHRFCEFELFFWQ